MTVNGIYEEDDKGLYYVIRKDPAAARQTKANVVDRTEEKWTIERLWDEYQAANPGLKGMGVYRAIYNAHLSRAFGWKAPAEITPSEVDRLKLDQMKGKSPKTVANTLELLRRIVNFGVRRGLCTGFGFPIQLPRVNNEKTEDLSAGELARLVSVLDGHLQAQTSHAAGAAMMKLALYTGMRRGEMFRLKWTDLDFHRNNILLREPKGGHNVVIPMSSHARILLESLKVFGGDFGAGSRSDYESPCVTIPGIDCRSDNRSACKSEYVFPGRGGGRRSDIRRQVNAIKAEAGLPQDFRPLHGLRHVFASGLISCGVEFQVVRRLLTHKGGTVTHRYAHFRDDVLRQAAELAGQLVG